MRTILVALAVAALPLGLMADPAPSSPPSAPASATELTPAQQTQLAQIKTEQEKQAKAIEGNAALTPAQKQVQLAAINRVALQQSEAVKAGKP